MNSECEKWELGYFITIIEERFGDVLNLKNCYLLNLKEKKNIFIRREVG